MNPRQLFVTRQQLASRWNVSIATLKRREKAGELLATRLGPRTIRYSLAAIEEMERCR